MNTCFRNWEVEAALDGRISGPALTDLDRHVDHCVSCATERRSLYAIRSTLLESARAHAPDAVTLRRIRNSTLRGADAAMKSPRPRRRLGYALVAALLVSLTAAANYRVVSTTRPVETIVEVFAAPNASWSSRVEGGAKRIELRDGSIDIVVHRKPGDPKVLLFVPDGEIEDIGTTFTVSVVSGHTESIRVSEGAVLFRKHYQAPIRVEAGSSWMAPAPEREPSPVAECSPALASTAGELLSDGRAKRPSDAKKDASTGSRSAPVIPPHEASSSPRLVDLQAPSGAEEDAAYLYIITLLREGRHGEAKSAAGKYLEDFPSGFRRPEVARIIEADAAPSR